MGVRCRSGATVAPDGTRLPETRFDRELPPETLAWLYEMMVVTRELDIEFGKSSASR